MSKGSAPTPPPPPDPGQQLGEEARYNRVDVNSPFGSITYSGDYRNQADISLSPEQQALYDLQSAQGIQGGQMSLDILGNLDPSGVDYSSLPGLDVGDTSQYTQGIYDKQVGLMAPQFAQQFNQMNADLTNRGIPIGSEIYGQGMDTYNRGYNQAHQQAALGAIGAGSQEHGRLFQQALQARQQMGNEANQAFQTPFNVMAALNGYNQLSVPQFQGAQPLDVSGAYGREQAGLQNQYNAEMNNYQSQNAGMLGMAQAAGSFIPMMFGGGSMFSSIDYKTDRESITILDKLAGIPVERWRYKDKMGLGGELHIGPYAEDWYNTFGTGDGKSIPILDVLGVLLGGMKELTDKVRRLENGR